MNENLLKFMFIFFIFNKCVAIAFGNYHDNHQINQIIVERNGRKKIDEDTKKSLLIVLESNEKLHQSFYHYDAKKVEKNALKIKSDIEKIKNEEIVKLLNFSKSKLSLISSQNDREENNNNYHLFSMALIHIIKKYDVGPGYNAYSCPMVKKKWIQNSKKVFKVLNPYAPNMPHCGSKDSNF